MLIRNAASRIRNLWKQVNAAAMYISAGAEFRNLHALLSKNSRHDRKRVGWYRAFNEPEGKFGCDRRTAERCIKIFEAFGDVGAFAPTWKLPQHFRALASLAALRLSAVQLGRVLFEETIGQNSTTAQVRKLGEALGLIEPKKPATKKTAEPASATIPTLAWAWTRATMQERIEHFDSIGPQEVRKVLSKELRDQLRDGFERQRQHPLTKKIARKTVEMAAFDQALGIETKH
jgi:hypothetical protein